MNRTLDKIFLYILCYFMFFRPNAIFHPKTLSFCLLIFCISGILFYFDTPKILWVGGIAFILICYYFSTAFFFFPFIIYDAFYKKKYPYLILYLFPIIFVLPFQEKVITLFYLCFLSFLAFTLAKKSANIYVYQKEIMRLKDDSRELKFLTLKQQQQSDERHANELHISKLQERTRIAREIHDNVGHMLSRSILIIGAMKVLNHQKDLSETIDTLKDTLDDAMNSIRESVHDLKDDSFDLETMIQSTLSYYTKYEIKFDYLVFSKLPLELKYTVLAIIKEALSNTQKHSNATKINILFHEQSLGFRLLIEDNGFLTPSNNTQSKTASLLSFEQKGIGLTNMKDRICACNGSIRFVCENGFSISIFIPKAKLKEKTHENLNC